MESTEDWSMTLKMAVPNKGRLNERSLELLRKSGLEMDVDGDRKLYAAVENKDFEVMFVRAQDIPRFVHSGTVDVGITGLDLVLEADLDVDKVLDLDFGHCRLSVAVPESSGWNTLEDIPEGAKVATSFPNLAWQFFASKDKMVEIVRVSGATEITPHIGVADAIVDLVSSGSTLRTNRMVEIATIMHSQAVMIANPKSIIAKEKEIEDLASSIESVLIAEKKKYLMADILLKDLPEVERLFPGMAGPTVMNIAGRDDMVAIHVVIDKSEVYDAVNTLKSMGAQGILILPIDRLVP